MEILSKSLLFTHILFGSISLVLFWIPAITKKGGNNHVRVGRIYVWCMWVVVLSAGILSIENYVQGNLTTAAFLGYLAVLTANPLWHAVSILKNKKEQGANYILIYRILLSAVFLFACLLLIYGYRILGERGSTLFFIFGIIGMPSGYDLYRLLTDEKNSLHWYRVHLSGMIVTGIAAYTAFFAFGGSVLFSKFLVGQWMIIPWVLPTIIGSIVIAVMSRRHSKALSISQKGNRVLDQSVI